MSEARAALIFWFFFIKEKEHPPAALRAAHPAPHNDDYGCHFLLFIQRISPLAKTKRRITDWLGAE
jgi:hypothetical protein